GTGIFGWASATSGAGRGLYGRTDSPDGFGVQAKNTAAAGSGAAIQAVSTSNVAIDASANPSGNYVIRATNTNYPGIGGGSVFGQGGGYFDGGNAIGLLVYSAGTATQSNSTGGGYGVAAYSPSGIGVNAGSNLGKGVYAYSSFDWSGLFEGDA